MQTIRGSKMEKKRNKKQVTHLGKSYGVCPKCGESFKLKRKTKHSHVKKPNGICPKCGGP
jgi:RNA polymerase-binding transcription factor DksA